MKTKVSVPQLSKEWGVSSKKVVAFIEAGELRAVNFATKTDGRPRYLIDRADIERFEKLREVIPSNRVQCQRLRRRAQTGVKDFF